MSKRWPDQFGILQSLVSTDKLLIGRDSSVYSITWGLLQTGSTSIVTVGPTGSSATYICDGTDDDVTILAACTSLGSLGGIVFMYPGTYALTNSMVIPYSYTNIIGSGFSTIVKLKNSSSLTTGQGAIQTKPYCQIRDMIIDGNKANNTYGCGLYVYESARSMFNNLYFRDCKQDAIRSEGTSSSASSHANKYTDISIIDCDGYGVFAHTYSYDLEFLNLWIGRCNVGYRVEDSDNCLTNLHVRGSTGNGVELRGDYNRITNCYLETNGGKGLDLFGSDGNIVSGGNIRLNGGRGINASDSNKNSFSNCEIVNNTGEGILLSGTSADNTIGQFVCYDNQSSKTQTYGIRGNSTTFRTLVTGSNSLTTNHVTAGLLLQGTGDKADTANNIIN